jgi:3',5'-cyclic-AMP phosphodiesterase
MAMEVTSVADDFVVMFDGDVEHRYDSLTPDTQYTFGDTSVRTLPRPAGELLSVFATVNDVHFGEFECGADKQLRGPVLHVPDGSPLHPTFMNAAAITEIAAINPDAVVVKGDLTLDGADHEFAEFENAYGVFGSRLMVIRGNHDAYRGQTYASGDVVRDLPGVRLCGLDTVIPHHTTGSISAEQIAWLHDQCATSDRPVLSFGHHNMWLDDSKRTDSYFGLHPDASDQLLHVAQTQPRFCGYFAGHTHRNRVRRHTSTGSVPFAEVTTVKDFPGSWVEYRVYEGGILQIHHRIASPEALAWSEQCRVLHCEVVDYVAYSLGKPEDRSFVIEVSR